ncbi:MAG: hypothetical protein WDW36_001159 [Sanguina aurantia]
MLGDPDSTRWIGDGQPLDRTNAWRSLAMLLGHWQLRDCGMWALELKDTGEFIGRAGLMYPDGWPDLELGWMLKPGHRHHGYATEASKAVLEFAWRHLHAPRVISLIRIGNEASDRVAERLGARLKRRSHPGQRIQPRRARPSDQHHRATDVALPKPATPTFARRHELPRDTLASIQPGAAKTCCVQAALVGTVVPGRRAWIDSVLAGQQGRNIAELECSKQSPGQLVADVRIQHASRPDIAGLRPPSPTRQPIRSHRDTAVDRQGPAMNVRSRRRCAVAVSGSDTAVHGRRGKSGMPLGARRRCDCRAAPYHLESLLTMYDLYRHMGENAFAEEVLSRALYALEMAWHPSFSIGTAACRLEYEVEENRPLFVALFRHILALSRQGCHATALECVKFLLALDPEDPMGVLCMCDYLAIRAGRYDYLPRFVAGFEGNRSLGLLPSYAYALALARFREEQEVARPIGVAGPPPGSSSSSSSSDRTSGSSGTGSCPTPVQSSCVMLVEAMLLHPLALPRLLAKLNEKGVAREKHWAALLQRKLFADASDEGSASLGHLVNLYAERSHLLWKAPDALEALREAATAAADLAEGNRKAGLLTANDWACLRRESFPESEVNEYRHMRLNDYSDAVNALPREEVQEAIQAGGREQVEDVMADAQEEEMLRQQIAAMQHYHQAAAQRAGGAVPPAMSEEELRRANPVVMMLRTLLPWVNAGQQPEYGTPAADDDDDVDEEIDGDNIGR